MVTRVPAAVLAEYLERLYRATGMSNGAARTMAAAHVEADLRGIPGHGSRLAPAYLAKLRDGRLNPRPEMTVRHDAGACLVLDADLAPGPVAARRATEASAERARRHGAGLVIVHRAGHAGALGITASQAAGQGMIVVVAVPSSSASVALLGGTGTPLMGNSALAVALPGSLPGQPVVLDMAAASTSWGRVQQHARDGLGLPDGLALDATGQPTRDPRKAAVLLPVGERAQAAAITLQVLLSVLAGTASLPDGTEGRLLLSLAVDPARLGVAAVSAAVNTVSGTVRGNGARMPGDRGWAHRASALRNGIEVDDSDLAALIAVGHPDTPAPPGFTRFQRKPVTPRKETPP
ncbi:MAG TPA: Ldh family oxidoreductase [Trebonia sp.]|nr:Ldh family oxidoreductase [Trebonia sp.]